LKVLIVDDEPDVRALVRSALSYARQDLTAVEAGDGDEALAMIHAERPDLVVLDLALPKRTGSRSSSKCARRLICRSSS